MEKIIGNKEFQEKIYQKLLDFVEKRVLQEEVGYMQYFYLKQRKYKIRDRDIDDSNKSLEEEIKKGYTLEDIEIGVYTSTHSGWYNWVGLELINKLTQRKIFGSHDIVFHGDIKDISKEDLIAVKDLEKSMKTKSILEYKYPEALEKINELQNKIDKLQEEIDSLESEEDELEDEE